jgi:hypothetical protein
VALKVSLPAGIDIVDAGDLRGEMIWAGTDQPQPGVDI